MEGWEQMREAMLLYKQCKDADTWPGYPEGVQKIRLPGYAFRLTKPEEMPVIKAIA